MYDRIIREAMQTPWVLSPRYLAIVQDILYRRSQGHRFTAAELAARIAWDKDEERPKPKPSRAGGIAIVPIYGVIAHRNFEASSGMTSTEMISAMLQRVAADEEISTVLLDCCTPGGGVVGIPELGAEIFALRKTKHICALVNGDMCSGGHWLGSQAHEISSIPSGYCGSIGVYLMTEDLSEYLKKEGIKIEFIHAGEDKVEGFRFWEPMSDETRERLQADVNRIHREFLSAVAKGRGTTAAAVKKAYGTGRVYGAKEALELGIIDRIETVSQTIARLSAPPKRRSASASAAAIVQAAAVEQRPMNAAEVSEATALIVDSLDADEPPATVASTETFGCVCGINCHCQDGQREWCGADCERCAQEGGDCACQQRVKAAAAPVAPTISQADRDALTLATALTE